MAAPFDLGNLKREALLEIQDLIAGQRGVTPMLFRTGERIIREGDTTQYVYVVLEGAYRVEKAAAAPGERPSILALVTCDPGCFSVIGEMAGLGEHVRTASVFATADTRVLCLEPAHLEAIVETCPKLTGVLLRQFAARLFEANQRILELEEVLARQARRMGRGAGRN
jgi:CRP-like cAMP-binding protein